MKAYGERRVLTEVEQLLLYQTRVRLNLVHGRHDPRRINDLLQLLDPEVGHSNSLDLVRLFTNPDKLLPRLGNARRVFVDGPVLPVGRVGHKLLARLEGHGPVNEVHVQVGRLQLPEGQVEVGLDVLGAVRVVP